MRAERLDIGFVSGHELVKMLVVEKAKQFKILFLSGVFFLQKRLSDSPASGHYWIDAPAG